MPPFRELPLNFCRYSWSHVALLYGAQEAPWTKDLSLIAVDGSGQPSRPLRLAVSVVEDARCVGRSPLVIALVATCCAVLVAFCVAGLTIWLRR